MRQIWNSLGSRTSSRNTGAPAVSRSLSSCTVTSGSALGGRRRRRAGRWRDAAELIVVDQLADRRVVAAHRALRIAPQLQLAEAHVPGVVEQQPADQRRAAAEQQLDRFGRLNRADDARQHAEHAAFRAARHQAGRRRLRVEAAIARAVLRGEHRGLPLEPEDAAVGVRLAEEHAGVVDQVAGREVVGAVEDDVVVAERSQGVGGRQRGLVASRS